MQSKIKKRPRIAIVLRTNGLEYDDRVRKECLSLSKIADLKIFVTFENNVSEEGVTSYGIPYKSFTLKSRKYFNSGRFLLIKALEFYFLVRKNIKNYDIIWAHEEYTFVFPLLLQNRKIIWDQHEIPSNFLGKIMKLVFQYIEQRIMLMVHANRERIEFLINSGLIKLEHKHKFINNLPDNIFINSNLENKNFKLFQNWKGNSEYVYLQGIGVQDRYPYNSVSSILDQTDLKVCIIGEIDKVELERLKSHYKDVFDNRVFMLGMIKQLETPMFMKNAKFSMVFYDISNPNNRYCEANRFYQSVVLGVPVIVGNNDSMSNLVMKHNFGIALKSDGSDVNEIKSSIRLLLENYLYYKSNAIKNGSELIWDDKLVWKVLE